MPKATAKCALLFVFSSLWLWCSPSTVRAQPVVGRVTAIQGTAELQRAGSTSAVSLATAVELHDQLKTGTNSTSTVTLLDNSAVELGESSALAFDENVVAGGVRQKTVVSLLGGGLTSRVTSALLSGAPTFEVHTPNAVCAVRGTDFDTTYLEGVTRPGYEGCQRYTDLRVREGVVEVSNLANPSAVIEVDAGYETTVPCLLPPLTAGPLGITGAAGPGTSASSRSAGGAAAPGSSAASSVSGFSAPPPGVGSSPPPAPPLPKTVQ
jgi:FecR protein